MLPVLPAKDGFDSYVQFSQPNVNLTTAFESYASNNQSVEQLITVKSSFFGQKHREESISDSCHYPQNHKIFRDLRSFV